MSGKPKNLAGHSFGRLRAVAVDRIENGYAYWRCECICGTIKTVRGTSLSSGEVRSCGCLHREQASHNIRLAVAKNTHTGLSRSPTYTAWYNMKDRCLDPTAVSYAMYGGRGIKVCDRWLEFENFLADMGLKPPRMTLERVNSDGHYEPKNCRWATVTEQANNRRSSRLLTYRGRTETTANWARLLNLPHNVLRGRISRGWPVDRALTTPLGHRIEYGALR